MKRKINSYIFALFWKIDNLRHHIAIKRSSNSPKSVIYQYEHNEWIMKWEYAFKLPFPSKTSC